MHRTIVYFPKKFSRFFATLSSGQNWAGTEMISSSGNAWREMNHNNMLNLDVIHLLLCNSCLCHDFASCFSILLRRARIFLCDGKWVRTLMTFYLKSSCKCSECRGILMKPFIIFSIWKRHEQSPTIDKSELRGGKKLNGKKILPFWLHPSPLPVALIPFCDCAPFYFTEFPSTQKMKNKALPEPWSCSSR